MPRIPRSQAKAVEVVAPLQWAGVMQVAQGVRSMPIPSKDILVIGPTHAFWQEPHPEDIRFGFTTEQRGFVWLDPPAGVSVATLDAIAQRLTAANVPHSIGKPATQDAALAAVVVATPAQVAQSMRDVVLELVKEAVARVGVVTAKALQAEVERVLEEVCQCGS